MESQTSDPIKFISKTLVLLFLCILAVFSILTVLSQIAGLSFRTYAILGTSGSTLFAFWFFYANKKRINFDGKTNKAAFITLVILGLACSLLTLISHRNNVDDYYYLPNAVYFREHPGESMGHDINYLDGGEDCEIVSHSWGTSKAFEYMQGAFSYITGIKILTIYYLIIPTVIGFLLPFTWYYLLSFFDQNPSSKAIGVLFTLVIVFLLAETHRTFGNFSITRAFQGKTLLLALGIPFFSGNFIDHLQSEDGFSWVSSLITITALTGATNSTLVLLPILTVVITIAYLITYGISLRIILRIAGLSLSFLYSLIYGLYIKSQQRVDLGMGSPVNQGWPTDFEGHWHFVFRENKSITLYVLLLSTVCALIMLKPEGRKFIAAWILGLIALFLNPLIAPLVIKHITSPNIYWRLFYLYPFPLVLGIANALAANELLRKKTALKISSLFLYILALGFAFSSPRTISIFNPENKLRFPPQYKLPETQATLAPKIIDETPEGTMLSPPEFAGIIPLFSASHPQIRIREDGLRLWFATCGLTPQAAELRFAASNFVGGDRDEFSKFKGFLKEEGDILTSILIHHSVLDSETQELLNTHHFVFQTNTASYAIFLRR